MTAGNGRNGEMMNTKLYAKLEKAGKKYLDLLLNRIEKADKTNLKSESIVEIDQAMRMAAYIVQTLRKIEREQREDNSNCCNSN